jgi:hypothetical protein
VLRGWYIDGFPLSLTVSKINRPKSANKCQILKFELFTYSSNCNAFVVCKIITFMGHLSVNTDKELFFCKKG